MDEYLYEHDDFLVFFAGGNNGAEGYGTILSPALSKNAVAVAATYSTVNVGDLAWFSSVGPAPDGRTKPVRAEAEQESCPSLFYSFSPFSSFSPPHPFSCPFSLSLSQDISAPGYSILSASAQAEGEVSV